MKKYIFALLILIGCQEEEQIYCIDMKVSNALPIQFWRNGVASFNQSKYSGVDKFCWFQPINCEDEIKIAIENEYGHFKLIVLDNKDNELQRVDFEHIEDNLYLSQFTFNQLSICNKFSSLGIIQAEDFFNSDFENNPDAFPVLDSVNRYNNWYQVSDSGLGSWTPSAYSGSGAARISINTSVSTTEKKMIALRHNFFQIEPTERTIHYSFRSGSRSATIGAWTGGNVKLLLYKNGVQIYEQTIVPSLDEDTDYTGTALTDIDDFDAVGILVTWTNSTSGGLFLGSNEFFVLDFDIEEKHESDLLAYTDLLDVKEFHRNTRLIYYTNELPFAGIAYDDNEPVFSLRVLSKFFEVRMQQEDESEPDAEGNIVKLSGSVKPQKQFIAEAVPPYMVEKLTLIFKHSTIWIENEAWIAEETVEIEKLDERSPFFNVSVWLTKADNNFYSNVG